MANKSALHATGAPFPINIELGKIREFATATLSNNPSHLTGDHPISPPTFLTTMFFWEPHTPNANPWPQVALDPQRGMHAEQEYIFHGPPPRAGDRLIAQSRIEQIYEKTGRRGGALTFAVMVTEFRDHQGKLVAEARLTGVETEKPPELAPTSTTDPSTVKK